MITKTVTLSCSIDRAFELFTAHAGEWWPRERRHTDDPSSEIRIEATGRFFERSSTGVEVDLGLVRVFEAPMRLVLDWYAGTGDANPTQVEVVFQAVPGGALVTVTHGPGAADPELFGRNAPAFSRGWDLVLAQVSRQT